MIEGLKRPFGVNQDSKGQIIVADFIAAEVLIFTEHNGEHQKLRIIRHPFLIHPHSIAFDRNENLIVCDYGSKKVLHFTSAGDFIGILLEGLAGPASCYLDPDGDFVVSDYGANAIKKFAPNGVLRKELTGLNRPHAVTFDQEGSMYVVDTWNHKLKVYNRNWNFLYDWPAIFEIPVSVSIANYFLVISENGKGRIRCFNLISQKECWLRDGFNMPYDVKLIGERLLVADADHRRIYCEEIIELL